MADLKLVCFGDFQVTLSRSRVTAFQTDKTRALLVYLSVDRQEHQRAALARFFWPGYSDESARNSLRQSLHQLRQLLRDDEADPPWLVISRQTVQINLVAPIHVDVVLFQQLIAACATHNHSALTTCAPCLARLRQAVDLYRGDFLTDFIVDDSDPFEEWRRITQEQLHVQMLDALTQLADASEEAGDEEGALQAAQRQLSLEPWLESAHRQRMRILARRGQQAAAIAQYERCRQVLAEELGVQPDAATTALLEQIQRGEFDKTGRQEDGKLASLVLHSSPATHNLPAALTPFVGRTHSLAESLGLLQKVRLLTLVGPGGMGKTRLTLEIGRQLLPHYPDGVWFVSLAAITSQSAIGMAIANTLGIATQGGEPGTILSQFLQQKRMLLILDNFEHLLGGSGEGVDLVAALLQSAPELQILVTSRERLNLRAEQIYQLPPLTIASNATLEEASAASAIRLFVQSAQSIDANFRLTNANLAAVLRICKLVDGMPLGLELAAANVGGAALTDIADAIVQSAEYLAVEWRDLPARQRSMRAVFAWSWQLLTPDEQRALRQMSIFRGGFDLRAAQIVTGATLPLLTRLMHKSLLQPQEASPGAARYLMHELLRQFAAEELSASGDRATVEAQHGRYYLAYLATRGLRLGRWEPKEASAEIQVELDNIRLAWQWAATHGGLAELDQATYSWWQFFQFHGLEAEACQSFALALEGVRRQTTLLAANAEADEEYVLFGQRLLAKLLAIHADTLFAQGRDEEMAAQAREAIRVGRASGGVEGEIFGTFVLGRALQELNQHKAAGDLWRQTIQLIQAYQPSHPDSELLRDLNWMAYVWLRGDALHFGDDAGGRVYMVQALQLAQALGKRRYELHSLSALARTDFFQGNFATAESGFVAALALAQTLGYRPVEMGAQGGLGDLLRVRGDYPRARALLEQAVATATELALPYDESLLLANLVRLYSQLGDQARAAERYEQLAQLLAQVKLPKECQLAGWSAAALKAHYAGENQSALRYAEQAHQLAEQGEIQFRQMDTALIVGHIRGANAQWKTAASAYQQALAAFQQLGNQALMAEPRAGLAKIALAQGDLGSALAQVEAILPVLAKQPHAGYNDPFFIYLTCYRVLAAHRDVRAASLLQQGYELLQQDAATLDDESCQHFLDVAQHRDLIAAYEEMRLQNAPVTSPHHIQPTRQPATPSTLLDWAEMPMVDFFVERTAEVTQLTTWLTPAADEGLPAQLISILGIGGMGKTTLAAVVSKAVAPNFAVVIWRSLLNAPPLSELLRNWLQVLARQTLSALPESLDEQLRLLLTYLQQERCLLVLDNVESIFVADTPGTAATQQAKSRAGVTRPGYEGYDQLFQRLASSEHQSCLLLTSREQPYALVRSGRQAQTTGRVQVLPLAGLDQQAGEALLASNGLHTSPAEAAQLIGNYSGNPLALQIVAATIADFFGGDVAAFQREGGNLFDGMRLVLDQQFARLSPLEQEILVWLAVEREPVTVPMLRGNFVQPVAIAALLEALQALQNRSLLEKRENGLTLQNVIIEYMTEYLVEQVCREIVDEKTKAASGQSINQSASQSPSPLASFSFLNRFALIKAQSKEYTRQSQERLILQPVAAQLQRRWEQRALPVQVQQMLNELREKGIRHGYAAGNLLNLLIHLGVDLNGYDFSGLSVWQADLRRSTVQNVNLAQTDLSYSSFTQTFSRIESVAISPDGQLLAAAGDGGAIRLFRLPNGEAHHLLTGHTNTITSVAFSPDGATLASTGDDGMILLWTIPEGRLQRQLNEQIPMRAVVFSPDGRLLVGASHTGEILLWQVESGDRLRKFPLHRQRVNALAFHPDGNLLASVGSDGAIYLIEMSDVLPEDRTQAAAFGAAYEGQQGRLPVRTLVAEQSLRFFAATFSPDGKRFVAGCNDGKLHVWDAPFEQQPQQTLAHRGEIRAVAFCADSRFLFSAGNDSVIRLWDSTDMHCCQSLTGHKETVHTLALGLQSRLLASGSEDAALCLWEVNPQTQSILRQRMVGYPQALECVAWSGCGRWLATGDIHGVARLWDTKLETPRCTQEIRSKSAVISMNFTTDGQQLVISLYADSQGVQIWEVDADDRWQLRSGYRIPTEGLASLSPNNSLLATCTPDGEIHLWNMQTLKPKAGISRLIGHSGYVNRVAFTAEGQTVASCGSDLTVRLWHLATGEEIQRIPGYSNNTCLAINAQDTLLACSSPNFGIALWPLDRTSTQPLRQLIGHTNEAFACAFSPDGKHLVSAGLDRSVRLWDVESGALLTLLGYHEQYALDVAFHPDGKQVATIGKEGALQLWQLSTHERRHQLHAPGPYAGMNITGVTGISEAQKAALRALGAVEK